MFSAMVTHVLRMLIAPLLLAVAALLPVRRIILAFVAVIVSLPSSLALAPAADDLVRMIPRGLEQFSAVRATGTRHYPFHSTTIP
jgi:hypothetical protein